MMTDLLRTTVQEFQQRFQGPPTMLSQAPGHIKIIGEHTESTGGLCLSAAIDCWTLCAWKLRDDDEIHIINLPLHEEWTTTWKNLPLTIESPWKKYVGGSIHQFAEQRKSHTPAGFNLVICGNVPIDKGVSSSSSLELAVLNGLNSLYKEALTPLEIVLLGQKVEHHHVNVKSGLLDQSACQFSKKNSALLIDFLHNETQSIALHPELQKCAWVLIDSLIPNEHSQNKHSERLEEFYKVQKTLDQHNLTSLRQLTDLDLERIFKNTDPLLYKRARHIVSENRRTLKAFEVLKNGDVRGLGQILYESHSSLSDDGQISHPQLDFLIETSKVLQGVLGGRMVGTGFGGCALFLVEKTFEHSFSQEISDLYENFSQNRTHPRTVEFVDGASAWTYGN